MSLASATDRVREYAAVERRRTVIGVLFGDRIGLLAFLGSLCLFGIVWQTAVFITDTYALVNGLYALSNGDLFLTEAAYGPSLDTPGVNRASGGLIARNYGVIVLSLPFWVVLESIAAVASLRVALVGLWSLALLAFIVHLGRALGRDTTTVAAGLALAVFVANVAIARPLDPAATHLYALQLFHITVAAFGPVLCYRLLRRLDSERIAVAATTLLLVGTPLALWATIAKRHAVTSTVVLAVAYALYRSRADPDGALVDSRVTFRALAYALVGLYAWVQAPEALLMLVVLAAVDVPTARDNSPRTLAIVAGVFLLSLLPFFLTNLALTGSPVEPPRLFATAGSSDAVSAGGSSSAGGGSDSAGGGSGVTSDAPALPGPVLRALGLLSTVTRPLQLLARELGAGATMLATDPAAFWQTLVRSGDAAATLNISGSESVNLSLLESAPVLGALVGGLSALGRRLRDRPRLTRLPEAGTVVDAFAILLCTSLTLLYASRLPIHAQLTVRYLFPLFPLGVYLLVRLPVVRTTLHTHWRLFAWSTAGTVLIGGQLIAVAVFATAVGLGEAFQLHALLALATATPLAAWSLLGRSDGRAGQAGAVLVGVATGLSTVFVLLVALEYYSIGDSHLLPMVRLLAERVELL
ncbi:hypothetical protein [Haloarcula onubensis]|uniref:Uncharacterized protein n=1 Tax=Haloarcula onubensis TaxID=2950539 RepID=A0ABU2FLC9_9EURY|nr:hypothetical protein [Halomicroarcula sp. S3CR25-11]MDS0281553.1 hypothetical protein [Halomicroarcula sp. S3CR25-11]